MNGQSIKWHRMTAEDAVLELDSNAACGLSRKAARSRRRRDGVNDFFDEPPRRVWSVLKQYWSDPAILLFALATLLALCFLEGIAGVVSLIFLLGWEAFLLCFAVRTNRFECAVAAYRIPTVCVVRDGRRLTVSARHVVKGDVLLLRAGDLIPCDCRLLTQQNLRVRTFAPKEGGQAEWILCKKNADAVYPYSTDLSVLQLENMLFAGSEILAGEARAIVVAIGKDVYLSKNFRLQPPPVTTKRHADPMRQLRPYLKLDSILLLALLLPMTLLSFLSAQESSGTFTVFLPVCAVACVGAFSVLSFCCHASFYRVREHCFFDELHENRGVLKSADALENLASVSDIFILGKNASSDGKIHLKRAVLGNREVPLQGAEPHSELQNLCEAYLLLAGVLREQYELEQEPPVRDEHALQDELLRISAFDREALDVRLSQVSCVEDAEKGIVLEVSFREEQFQLLFADSIKDARQCLLFDDGAGLKMFSEADWEHLLQFEQETLAKGLQILSVMKRKENRWIFVGAMALGEDFQDGLADTVEQLRQSGVRVTFFLEDAKPSSLLYARLAGLPCPVVTGEALRERGGALADYYEKYRCFCGFSGQEILDLLTLCQSRGRKVAVLGHGARDYRLFCRADLSVACDVAEYHKKSVEEALQGDLTQFGTAQSDRCAPMLRRKADLLIGRANRHGGGLETLMKEIFAFRAAGFRTRALLPTLATAQLTLLLYALFGRVFGCCVFNTFQALLGGVGMMLLLTGWMLSVEIPQKRLHKWLPPNAAYLKATFQSKKFLLPMLLGGIIPSAFAAILKWCGVLDNNLVSCYLFVSLILVDLASFFRHTLRRGIALRQKSHVLPLLICLVGAVILAALAVLSPAINRITGLGYWKPVTLLALPIAPAVYCLCGKLLDFLDKTTK